MWKKTDKLDENQRLFLNQSVVLLATIYHYEGIVRFNIPAAVKNIYKSAVEARLTTLAQIEKGQPQTQDIAMADIEAYGRGQVQIGNPSVITDTHTLLDLYEYALDMTDDQRKLIKKQLKNIVSKLSKASSLELSSEEFKELCISFYLIFIGDPSDPNYDFSDSDYLEALETLTSAFKDYCDITNYDERDLTIWVNNKLRIYNKYGTFGYD